MDFQVLKRESCKDGLSEADLSLSEAVTLYLRRKQKKNR